MNLGCGYRRHTSDRLQWRRYLGVQVWYLKKNTYQKYLFLGFSAK